MWWKKPAQVFAQYFKFEYYFLKMNITAISKYGISYFLSILYELMDGCMKLVYFVVMFGTIDKIVGWERDDVFLLIIISYFIDCVCVMFFIGTSSIPDYISTGVLDILLTKPINHQFLLCFRRPNAVQIVNVVIATGAMIYEVVKKNAGFMSVVLFGLSIALSVLLMYLVMSSMVFLSFWVVRVGNIWTLVEKLNSISSKPAAIYPKTFQLLLTFAVPSIIMINYPVEILRFDHWSFLFQRTIPVVIIFFVINRLVFKAGIKHYAGAGG